MDKDINQKVDDLISSVLRKSHTETEWFELEIEFNKIVKGLPRELEDKILDSGAGEVLYMICSGIRYEKEQKAS